MQVAAVLLLLMIFATNLTDVQSQCDITEYQNCTKLYRIFRDALFNSSDNLFLLHSVFYPSTQITPVLVKVIYKLNITSCQEPNFDLTVCPTYRSKMFCERNDSYIFGWTNREIYRIFHPAVVNQLKFQLPYFILQNSEQAHELVKELDVDALLWDGTRKLTPVTLQLDIDFSSVGIDDCKCDLMNYPIQKALGELNQWVSFSKHIFNL